MCTIMTFSREIYDANKNDIIDRIYLDAKYNGHGFSLLTVGENKSQVNHMRSTDIESLITQLEHSPWTRFWLHTRWATGSYKGIAGCHGFVGVEGNNEWFVFHNGSFHNADARTFNVDSEWAAWLIDKYGHTAALSIISNNSSFANMFFVSPSSEEWYMLRMTGGSLHTDGLGNYSTNTITGLITTAIATKTCLKFPLVLAPAPSISKGSITGTAAKVTTTKTSNKLFKSNTTTKKLYPYEEDDWGETQLHKYLKGIGG